MSSIASLFLHKVGTLLVLTSSLKRWTSKTLTTVNGLKVTNFYRVYRRRGRNFEKWFYCLFIAIFDWFIE